MFALTMALKLPKDQRDAAATAYINAMVCMLYVIQHLLCA